MRSSRQNARLTASLLGVSLPNAAQENEPNG
jgi:hypothetical protein